MGALESFRDSVVTDHLRLGCVVQSRDSYATRGVVVWSNGMGLKGHLRLSKADSYVIEHGIGHYVVGNSVGDWVQIPDVEWTTKERVLSELVCWDIPPWVDHEDGIAENDELGFALMRGLLPTRARDEIFGEFSWPTSYEELALSIARWLDEELLHRGIMNGILNYAD